jgi:hypothetical protein
MSNNCSEQYFDNSEQTLQQQKLDDSIKYSAVINIKRLANSGNFSSIVLFIKVIWLFITIITGF